MASEKLTKIADDIQGLTLVEASDLVKMLEEKLGVSAAAPVAMATMAGAPAAGGAAGGAAPAVEEKTAPASIKKGATKEEAAEAKKKLEEVGASVEIK
jgi:large subunit ribosomal protein L7/L12